MLELSDTQKLMLVASCAGLVTATILVTVCVVTPHCWLYHCIWGKDDEQERRKKLYYGTDVIPLPACPVTTKTLSASSEKSVPSSMSSTPPWTPSMFSLPFVRSRQARDSTYSSMSTASSRGETSIYGDSSGDVVSSRDLGSQDEDLVFGNLAVSLRFQPHSSLPTGHNVGYPAGKLIVNIREAQNLPPRAYGGVCDPYALVRVFKGRLKKRRSSSRKSSSISGHCISQCQTQVKRKTQCPLFNEAFSVDLVRGELKECSLHVALFDLDKVRPSRCSEVVLKPA